MALRIAIWIVACGVLLVACGTGSAVEQGDGDVAATHSEIDPPPWPWELAAQGVDVPASVPLDEIRSGGPPPDGIPPIDEPVFESVTDAEEWLEPQSPVLVVDLGGEARAYPLAILTFHEIVNDHLDGRPVLVTYCPLCNSGLVFERTLDGEVLSFGTSGGCGTPTWSCTTGPPAACGRS